MEKRIIFKIHKLKVKLTHLRKDLVLLGKVVSFSGNRFFSDFVLVPIALFIFYPQYLFFWKAKNASKSIKLYLALFLPSFFRLILFPFFKMMVSAAEIVGKLRRSSNRNRILFIFYLVE